MSIEFTDKNVPFVNLGDGYEIRLEYENITENKYLEKAKNELRETPENIENGLKELRELIKSKLIMLDFGFVAYI
jgi:prefoldin subunit 5